MNNYSTCEELLKSSGYSRFTESIMIIIEYGSSVYGTVTDKSDFDLICIVDSEEDIYEVLVYREHNLDLHLITFKTFEKLLNEHDIMALETYYQLPRSFKALLDFDLNLDKLRRKVSAVCSNSWSKARKKLDIPEEDDYLGLKSLFHSIRILSYGIDIARDGKIDFKNVLINADTTEKISYSNLWNRILQKYESGWRWVEFKKKYTPLQNSNATLFRLLAPKELDYIK